jgi:hypothetical protein
MTNPIGQVFDSRDLAEYVEKMKEEVLQMYNDFIDDLNKENEDNDDWTDSDNKYDFDELTQSDFETIETVNHNFYIDYDCNSIEEIQELVDFESELSEYGDYKYGETIIRDDYWVEYCEELCVELGEIPKTLPSYIANHIDWEGVAKEMAYDYTYVSYQHTDYYIRNT